MKYLLTLCLVLSSFLVSAQHILFADGMPKGTNVIMGEMSGPADSVLVVVGRKLQSIGYGIDRLDKDLLSLTTQPKEAKAKTLGPYIMNVVVVQEGPVSKVYLRGNINADTMYGSVNWRVERKGGSGSIIQQSFEDMIKGANQLGLMKLEAYKE